MHCTYIVIIRKKFIILHITFIIIIFIIIIIIFIIIIIQLYKKEWTSLPASSRKSDMNLHKAVKQWLAFPLS